MKKLKIVYVAVFDTTGVSTNTSQAIALQKLGHQVFCYNYRIKSRLLGDDELRDKDIVQACKKIKPDLILFAKCNEVDIDVFKCCKNIAPLGYWFADPLITYNDDQFLIKTQIADFFCGDKRNVINKALSYNSNSYLIAEGYDSLLEKPKDTPQDLDISFIGNLYGDRATNMKHIKRSVDIINNAYGSKHSEIVSRTKINLNFCTSHGASDRVYKIMGAKGFLLTDDWEGRADMFEDGVHLVIYNDFDDLNEKIEYYLKKGAERDKIREQGYKEVQQYTRYEWAKKVTEFVKQKI